jgi:hypothetical protein
VRDGVFEMMVAAFSFYLIPIGHVGLHERVVDAETNNYASLHADK